MRGGLSLTEAYELTPDNREFIAKLVDENYETTKKTKMPHF